VDDQGGKPGGSDRGAGKVAAIFKMRFVRLDRIFHAGVAGFCFKNKLDRQKNLQIHSRNPTI
jgi:hypothetical protein